MRGLLRGFDVLLWCVLLSPALAAGSGSACAFDPLQWAKSALAEDTVKQPADAANTTAYRVSIAISGQAQPLVDRLAAISQLKTDEAQHRIEPHLLVARAHADVERMRAALYETGHFAAAITVEIDGKPLPPPGVALPAIAAGETRQVRFSVAPGAIFLFGVVLIETGGAVPPAGIPDAAALGLVKDAPASSMTLVKAIEKLVEAWRQAGHPLASIVEKDIRADHKRNRLDVRVRMAPGPPARLGWVSVTGANGIDGELVRRYGRLEPGQRFDPIAIDKAAERLRKLPAIESVRIQEGREVDHDGGIPLAIVVAERKPRYLGATTSMSTIDGGEVKGYWGHNNLLGGAETFRVEGGLSHIDAAGIVDPQYFAKVSLTKPALFDVATDLVLEAGVAKERPDSYESLAVSTRAGLSRKFSDTRTATLFLAATAAEETDAAGSHSYFTVSLPATFVEDKRDNRLDPTDGWRAEVSLEPSHELRRGETYLATRGQLSGYEAIDAGRRLVVAGRVAVANIIGADVAGLRPSQRLYAGGGGSVRGFAYRSLAPILDGGALGGGALVETSLELRMRISPAIGIVPFIDAASVSRGAWPEFGDVKLGAGVGLRYYTALGPLRFDVAVPLGPHDGQADVSFYVGLGQSF